MFGKIASFDQESKEGKILGESQKVYPFHIGEWLSDKCIELGQKVFYEVEEGEARNIEIDEVSTFHLKIDFRRG